MARSIDLPLPDYRSVRPREAHASLPDSEKDKLAAYQAQIAARRMGELPWEELLTTLIDAGAA
jgi:hypothetical protein